MRLAMNSGSKGVVGGGRKATSNGVIIACGREANDVGRAKGQMGGGRAKAACGVPYHREQHRQGGDSVPIGNEA